MNAHKNDSHETRIALLEQSIININTTLIRLEKKMDDGFYNIHKETNANLIRLEKKIDDGFAELKKELGSRIDKVELRIDKVESRLWQIMFLLSSSIVGVIIGKIYHWF